MEKIFHLSGKLLVSGKFVGGFVETNVLPENFIRQTVYVKGKKKVLLYREYPLPFFITKGTLKVWEKKIEKDFSEFSLIPAKEEADFLAEWLNLCRTASFLGTANYRPVEEVVRKSPLVVIYEYGRKRLILCRDAYKPVPDRKAVEYLYPLSCFPETIEKLGVENGS
jgi:hypothetical protein